MAHMRTDLSTGRRIYVKTAFGEPIVEKLKDLGAKWDGEVKCWWLGKAKKDAVEELLVSADREKDEGGGEAPAKQDPHTIRLTGKGRYKGRIYYAGSMTKDGQKVRLLTLPDAKGEFLDFWASCSEVEEVKRYEPRQVWDGRRYSGKTKTVYTTLGGIAEFSAREKSNKAAGMGVCSGCGKTGDLVSDLEDGLMKHRHCCDMPSGG
jgi:hypothetical protein